MSAGRTGDVAVTDFAEYDGGLRPTPGEVGFATTDAVTIDDALRAAARVLAAADPTSDSARLDAELLLAHVLAWSRERLLGWPETVVSSASAALFSDLVHGRSQGISVAHLVGRAPFMDLELETPPGVLVPRPETEELAAWAIARLSDEDTEPHPRVLDVGTGSGALALAIASAVPGARVVATDIDGAAIACATRNANRLALEERVNVVRADLFPPGPERFHMIVANLPYVGTDEVGDVAPGVLAHEPAVALFADADGLGQLRRMMVRLPRRLAVGGAVGLEIGWRQGPAVQALVRAALPAHDVCVRRDLQGRQRFVLAEPRSGRGGEAAESR